MNGFIRKMLIFVLVMAVVGAAGWYGRKTYKKVVERRAVAEAAQYLEKKDVRNALLCLQRARQVNPMSVPAAEMMADLLESAGIPAALGWRVQIAQLQPNNMTNRLNWAQTAINLKDLKSASDALAGLDEKSKSSARFHKLSGALAWKLGNRDEAEKQYREAQRLEPTNMAIVLNLDTINLASTNREVANAARASFERLTTNAEFRLMALHVLAMDATTNKSYAKAADYLGKIVREPTASVGDKIDYLQLLHLANDANFASWLASLKTEAAHSPVEAFALGRWMAVTENPTNAVHWLQSLPQSIQTNQPVPLVLADCFISAKDWNGLLTLAEKQDWAEANYLRLSFISLGQRSLRQETASQASWHKAVRLASHRLDHLHDLAQVTAGFHWDAENTEVLNEVISEFPKETWALNQLSAKLYAAGSTRELGTLLARVYAADSSDPRTKNNLANINLLRKADLDTAYRLAREAYDSSPDNPFFTSTYAYSLLLQKKQDEAVRILGNMKPEYLQIPSVAAYYGVVEAQAGHKDAARAPLQRAAAAKLLPEENEIVRLAMTRL